MDVVTKTTPEEREDTEAGALLIIQRLRACGKKKITILISEEIMDLQMIVNLIHDVNLLKGQLEEK